MGKGREGQVTAPDMRGKRVEEKRLMGPKENEEQWWIN